MKQSPDTSRDCVKGVFPTSVNKRDPLESEILYILIFRFAFLSNSSSGGALVAGFIGSGDPNSSTIFLGGGSFSSMMNTFASPPLMSSRIAHAAFTPCCRTEQIQLEIKYHDRLLHRFGSVYRKKTVQVIWHFKGDSSIPESGLKPTGMSPLSFYQEIVTYPINWFVPNQGLLIPQLRSNH